MRISLGIFLALILFNLSSNALAYSALSYPKDFSNYWYSSYGYSTQKEADQASLEGCRANVREKGQASLAKSCKVQLRQKDVGYGAITCGDNGCAFVSGYADKQNAIDTVYDDCNKSYSNCDSKEITAWYDDNYPSNKKLSNKVVQSKNYQTNVVHCENQCTNGDCIRTFSNGKKEEWSAPRVFNPMTNNWEWDVTTNACGI